ncbi:MAG TPA: hypothetical protein VEC12_15730 [Bacteroidia bacterium]|nr:hypothetical protein [Bacteroidia bacterium]
MRKLVDWKPDNINKWYNIKKEPYELIFKEGKERFEDLMSESESITNKSIKMLTAIVAVNGALGAFIVDKNLPLTFWLFILTGAFAIEVLILYKLIAPKKIIFRGAPPDKSIPIEFDSKDDKDKQIELFYYHNIVMLKHSIDEMEINNTTRQQLYKYAFGIFLGLLFFAPIYVFFLFRATFS